MECYNPKTDNWYFVAPLADARAAASANILGSKIFVVGGLAENIDVPTSLQILNSVEVFDPKKNR